MRKWVVLLVLVVGLVAAPAQAKVVGIDASPNPAVVGARVRHTVGVGAIARLDIWVSALGFQTPGLGTLPPGAWTIECCPSQTLGTSAWHYRSLGVVIPASYRFNAVARTRGTFQSTATVAGSTASVTIRIG
jgi:hypothetical protein